MFKRITVPLLAASALSLSLALIAAPAQAQPGEARGQGQGVGQAQGHPGQGRGLERRADEPRYREGSRYERREREQGAYRESRRGERRDWEGRRDEFRSGPRFDEREIRRIFRDRRDWVEIDRRDRLPPGIRKNLERGNPLPPGIAKRFDERLYRELPRYDGYEWRRVGADVVLVEMANDIVYAVLRDLLE